MTTTTITLTPDLTRCLVTLDTPGELRRHSDARQVLRWASKRQALLRTIAAAEARRPTAGIRRGWLAADA